MKKSFNCWKLNFGIIMMALSFSQCGKPNSGGNSSQLTAEQVLKVDLNHQDELSDRNNLDSLSIIRLETSKECLIGNINKIEILDNRIYILDKFKSRSLFCFKLSGEFEFKINNLGDGPGEFTLPEDFSVIDQEISIYDNFRKMKINYDLNGNFISETKMVVSIRNILQLDDGIALVTPDESYLGSEDDYNLLVTDRNIGKILERHIPTVTMGESIFSSNKAYSKWGTRVLFTYGFNDTIYSFDRKELKHQLVLDFGKNKIPYEIAETQSQEVRDRIFDTDSNYTGFLMDISENEDYISCRYTNFSLLKDFDPFLLYSKESKKVYNFTKIYNYEHMFKINPPKSVYKNKFVSTVAYDFKGESTPGLLPSETDNPALAIYTIKRGY
ncbi:6-bladed beta-propeller [Belliella sp. R4-6]|uniref:6-bladed beta-propeller n=1 Tax=Belliella alkalica TaxID=1730871 RepID=A0ABS9VD66_9BACT|nr:6-bladed beta-propeller [Belliella alkalica]MCH7414377.1 6-bladed beta-propeller [Belliella alkalica]